MYETFCGFHSSPWHFFCESTALRELLPLNFTSDHRCPWDDIELPHLSVSFSPLSLFDGRLSFVYKYTHTETLLTIYKYSNNLIYFILYNILGKCINIFTICNINIYIYQHVCVYMYRKKLYLRFYFNRTTILGILGQILHRLSIYEVRMGNGDKSMCNLCSRSHIKLFLKATVIAAQSYAVCSTKWLQKKI